MERCEASPTGKAGHTHASASHDATCFLHRAICVGALSSAARIQTLTLSSFMSLPALASYCYMCIRKRELCSMELAAAYDKDTAAPIIINKLDQHAYPATIPNLSASQKWTEAQHHTTDLRHTSCAANCTIPSAQHAFLCFALARWRLHRVT